MNAVLAKRSARSAALRINKHAAKLILDLAAGRLIERRNRADKHWQKAQCEPHPC